MVTASSCPPADVLQRLLLRQITDEAAQPLEAHLAHCDRCIATLQALQAQDPLVENLQQVREVAEQLGRDEIVQRLMKQLASLQPSGGVPTPPPE